MALEHETNFVHRVRKQLEHQQRPQSRRIRRRRPAAAFPLWPGLLAVAALIAVVIALTDRSGQRAAPAGWSCLAANDSALIGPLADNVSFTIHSGEATLSGPLGQRVVLTNANVRVDGDRLHLLTGRCDSTVPSLPAGRSYAVITPQATCTVVGTAFSVVIDNTTTHLAVREGTVHFAAAGQSRLVHAGESALHPPPSAPVTPLVPAMTAPVATPLPTPAPIAAQPLVRYTFTQPGPSVTDQGRLGLHLRIEDPRRVTWAADGLRLLQPTRLHAPGNALRDALVASRACTILIECTPAAAQAGFDTTTIGPARLLTLSQGPTSRCFTLGQGEMDLPEAIWSFRLRHQPDANTRNLNGLPSTWITLTVTRQRLAVCFDAQGVRWFRDGKAVAAERPMTGCVFSQWNIDSDWCVGDEAGNLDTDHRPWLGTLHRLEIHDRILGEPTIAEW